MLLITIVIC